MKMTAPFALVTLLGVAFLHAAEPAPEFAHAAFFDVSGSMKPLLGPPGSDARKRLAGGLFRSSLVTDTSPVAAHEFDVQVRRLPALDDRNTVSGHLLSSLRVGGGDTDMPGVLAYAEELSKRNAARTTLVWILTDNTNDPRGQGPQVENTRAFYDRLFSSPRVQRVYFIPMHDLRVVLYLLVLQERETMTGAVLDRFENALTRLATGLGSKRIRAKPVGGERPLEFDNRIMFRGRDEGISAQMRGGSQSPVLVVQGLREGEPLSGTFSVKLRSRFDEWRIARAVIERTSIDKLESAEFRNIAGNMSARLTPSNVSVDPRSTSAITYALDLAAGGPAPAPEAPFFSLVALNPNASGVVRGRLTVRVSNPKLELNLFGDKATTDAVALVFGLKDIEYFLQDSQHSPELRRLDFTIPVEFEVSYNVWPRWLFWGALALLLVAITGYLSLQRSRPLYLTLHGYNDQPVNIGPSTVFAIAPLGAPAAEIRRSWKGLVCRPLGKSTVNGRTSPVPVRSGSMIDISVDGTSFAYRAEVQSRSRGPARKPDAASGGVY